LFFEEDVKSNFFELASSEISMYKLFKVNAEQYAPVHVVAPQD